MSSADNERVVVRCDDAWAGTFELDTRWFHEWVDYGLAGLATMLGNQARFDAWRTETGR